MEYVLETKALSKNYGHYKALDELSMGVPKGSIYGFVGKNGAGKTTLIRLVCGLQTPTSGEYSILGIGNTQKEIIKSRRRMGAVIEAPSIYTDMTAEDNLRIQYRVLGLSSDKGISEILKMVGLENTGKKKVKDFSLGMRQRLGIAVALVGKPDFLVLDEPVNGLDPQGIVEIREIILKLNREREITVLISSHILDELSRLATYFGFIDNGKMVKEISAAELEAACRKCVHLVVSDVNALSKTLTEIGLDYTLLSNNEADVYGEISVSKLVSKLSERDCEVISMQERDESLENYYINLIGGASNV